MIYEENQHKRKLELEDSKVKNTSALLSNFTGQGINTESISILGSDFFSNVISSVLKSNSSSSSSSSSTGTSNKP